MDFCLLPGSARPLLTPFCLWNEDDDAAGHQNVHEERRPPGIWGQDADIQLLTCPEPLCTAERGGSADCVSLQSASVQLQTRQPPRPLEEVVWLVVCELRCCLRPGHYHVVPCFLPGSDDGFHLDGSLTGVERIWTAGKGSTLLFPVAVPVEVWGEYAKAKKEKRTWRLEDISIVCIMNVSLHLTTAEVFKVEASPGGAPSRF